MDRRQLGTTEESGESQDQAAIELGLSVRLDRPFHELKESLLEEFERAYLTRCLTLSEMNLSMASRASGLSRKHLRTLITKYQLRRRAGSEGEADPAECGELAMAASS
jgi:DNA-binding NtrC family response regulator